MERTEKFMIYSSKDSLIMTEEGLKYVSKLTKDDNLITANKEITKIRNLPVTVGNLLVIKGHGHPKLMVNKDQFILTSNYKRVWNKKEKKAEREFITPIYKRSEDIKGDFWASPMSFIKTDEPIVLSENLTWFMGAFLSGGYIEKGWQIYIKTNQFRYKELEDRLKDLGVKYTKNVLHAYTEYFIRDKIMVKFFNDTFNIGYGVYNIPLWVYSMDENLRKSFFEGFMWHGGVFEDDKYRISTGNKYLAIGIKLIAQGLGYSVALYLNESYKDKKKIERWQIVSEINARSSAQIGENRFGLVREVEKNERKFVITGRELERNESVILDGIVVKPIQLI